MDNKSALSLQSGKSYHPLQLIPYFRRWAPSTFRNLVFTALLCLMISALISISVVVYGGTLSWRRLYQITFFTFVIGYTQHYLYKAVIYLTRRYPGRTGWLLHPLWQGIALPIGGIYIGYVIAIGILSGGSFFQISNGWQEFIFSCCIAIAVSWALWETVQTAQRQEIEARQRAELQAVAERADKERARAELKTLRAQIEPHFLYNTLANIISLIDREPSTAKHITERLVGYLRHTLDASRRDDATLGDELTIIEDYLEILSLRMGERLSYSIQADSRLRAIPFSALLLQPLVENAIKHGIEPKIQGGHINISVHATQTFLFIDVKDTGLGFGIKPQTAGSGSGLANVRARLKALYGENAQLSIEQPKEGSLLRITLPLLNQSPASFN
ncbi:MAG: histidine kinase [Burkholderiaceae bacterium]|nr:histidine kinase [Burkholderiaceae bacterium]